MSKLPNNPKHSELSIQEAASYLGVSTKTLRRWEEKGIISSSKTSGGHRRYSLKDVQVFKRKKQRKIRTTRPQLFTPVTIVEEPQTLTELYDSMPNPQTAVLKLIASVVVAIVILFLSVQAVRALPFSVRNVIVSLLPQRITSYVAEDNINKPAVLAESIALDSTTFNVDVESTFSKSVVVEENLTVNGGTIDSSATEFNFVNENVETLSIGGAATTISIGSQTGSTTVNNSLIVDGTQNDIAGTLNLSGNRLTASGDLIINPSGGGTSIGTGTANSADMAGGDFFVSGDLEIDGTSYLPTFVTGGDTFTDLTGTGLQVSGGTLSATLGTSIESSEIADDTIKEIDLNVSNTAVNGYNLTYNSTTGGFTWVDGSGSNLWTDNGTITYLTSTTDDLAVGGTTSAAPFFFDESAELLTVTNATIGNDLNITAATDLIFGTTTSLGESTAANDSGAYLIGIFDEFSNSTATNLQDVIDDLDAAISGAGSGDITAVGDVLTGEAFTATAGNDGNSLYFEGATADGNEIQLTAEDPGSDIAVTLPNIAGTLASLAGTQTFTGPKTFNDLTIADTDISLSGATTTFTSTGAFTLTPGGAVLLGDGGDTMQINSSDWDISTTGAITNATYEGLTISTTTGTFTLTNGKTLAVQNSLTLAGTDSTTFTFPATSGTVVTLDATQTLTNKSLSDSTSFIIDEADGTKIAQFQASGITTGTTRTYTLPNSDGTLALTTDIPTSDNYQYWTVDGDDADTQQISSTNTLLIAGGTNGIDTDVANAADTITLNLDTTEIGTTTFGSGSGITWTFDGSAGTDTTLAFGDNLITATTASLVLSGDLTIQGGDITGANSSSIDLGEAVTGALTFTAGTTGDFYFASDADSFLGIGDSTPDYLLEVGTAASSDPTFALSDGDVAHGLTTYAEADVFGLLGPTSSTAGGLQLTGLTDSGSSTSPLSFRGFFGATGVTDTVPAFKVTGALSDGATGVADLAASDTLFQVVNNDNTAALTIFGDNDISINSTSHNGQLYIGSGSDFIDFGSGQATFARTGSGNQVMELYARSNIYDSQIKMGHGYTGVFGTTTPTWVLSADHGGDNGKFVISGDGGLGTDDFFQVGQSGRVAIGSTTADGALDINGNRTSSSWTTSGAAFQIDPAQFNDTSGSGTIASRVTASFGIPTYVSGNAVTLTDAANVYIAGAPTNGTGTTITNAWSLWVDAGNTRLDGELNLPGLSSSTGSALCLDASNNVVTCTTGAGGIAGSGTAGQIAFFDTASSIATETSGFGWDATNNLFTITGATGQTTQTTEAITLAANGITSGGVLSAALTSSGATASFTGDVSNLSSNRTNAAAQTLTDTGNILDLSRTTITNNAGATTNVTGSILNISNTATQTAGTLSDSANLVSITQDADATGALLYLNSNRSSTGTALLVEQSSGGTDILSLLDNGNLSILGDATFLGGALTLGSTTQDGSLVIHNDGTSDYSVTFQPHGTQTEDVVYTLPANNGDASQVLITDGSGALSWSDVTSVGGAGDITAVGDVSSGAAFTATAGNDGNSLYFEGSSVDGNEIQLTADDPGSDMIVTIPAIAGTLASLAGTQTFTGTKTFDDITIADTAVSLSGATTTFTSTGAFTLTPGGAVLLGDGGDTMQINTSDWDVSTTGDLTGIGAITADGTITFSGALNANAGLDVDDAFVVADGGVLTTSQTANFDGTADFDGSADFSANLTNSAGELLVSGGNLQLNDSINLSLGTGDDLTLVHNGTNTLITSATGDLIIDNTLVTGSTIFDLGTDTSATDVLVRNNSGVNLFSVNGAGATQLGSNGVDGTLTLYNELGATDYSVVFQTSASQTETTTYTLPVDDGTDNYVLTTNGSGVLAWEALTGIGGFAPVDATYVTATSNGTLTNEEVLTAGTGIDVTSGAGTITVDFDSTEIGDTTWGSGAGITWTFNAGATDPTIAFGSDTVTVTAGNTTLSGDLAVNGGNITSALTLDQTLAVTGITTLTGNLNANGGLDIDDAFVVADGGVLTTSQTANFDGTADFDGAADFAGGLTNSAGELLVSGGNLQLNDNINLTLGTGDDLTLVHSGTNTVITSATGDLIIDNTLATGSTIFDLGTDTSATDVLVRNNSGVQLFSVNGAGATQLGSNGVDGTLTLYNELGATDYSVVFQTSASQTETTTYTLPVDDGTDNYVLTTNGSGVLAWEALTGVGGFAPIDATYVTATSNGSLTNEEVLTAGTGIDVTSGAGTITVDFDSTEIAGTTWGAGSGFTWTFNAGTTDPTLAFADNQLTIGSAATLVATDVTAFNCTDCINFDDIADATTLDASTSIAAGAANTLSLTSSLSAAGRTADVFSISQANDATFDSTGDLIELSQADTASSGRGLYISNLGTGASLQIDDAGSDTTPFIVDADGDVGINFASPATELSIGSTATNSDVILVNASDGSRLFRLTETSGGTGWMEVDNAAGTAITLFRADAGDSYHQTGEFGFGTTSPDATVHIADDITTGENLEIDWTGATTQTGALTGMLVDFTNLTTLAGSTTYGIHVNDPAAQTTSTEYGIYQQGTNWDYGIYTEDDVYFATAATLNGTVTGNGQFTFGDNGDTGEINTSDWDISTTGSLTGIGSITMDGRLDTAAHTNNTGLNLPTNAGAPAAVTGTAEGDVVYDTTGNALYVYDGAAFTQIGGGAYTGWTLDGDDDTTETIASGNTVLIAGGTNGIDTDVTATDTITLNLDYTEITTATFGTGSGWTWTFDAGATDPTIAFADNQLTIGGAATLTATAVTDFDCTDCIDFDDIADALALDTDTSITAGAGEEITYAKTFTDATTENGIVFNFTASDTSAGTTAQFGMTLNNLASTEGLDALLVLDNADADDSVGDGIRITSAAGTILTGLDFDDTDIVTDIELQNGETIDNNTDNQINLGLGTSGTLLLTSTTTASVTNSAGALAVNAQATGLNLQADGSIDVNIAGGSGATGCTVANATGNITCSGDVTANGGTFNGAAGESIDLGVATADVLTFTTGGATELLLSGTNLTPGTAEGNALGSATSEWDQLFLGDDAGVSLGLDQDWSFLYDEATDDRLELTTAGTSGMLISSATVSGTGLLTTFDSVTTGTGLSLSVDALTTGTGFLVESAGSQTLSGDLFKINIGANVIATGNLFTVQDNSSNLFSVKETKITSALPHEFTAAGDLSVAYDIVFTNQTAGFIKSYGPLTVESGESFESQNLNLKTYNSGKVIADTRSMGVGTSTGLGLFEVDSSTTATFGKALAIFNHDESQDLITASASGTTEFAIASDGKMYIGDNTTLGTSTALCWESTTRNGATVYQVGDCTGTPADLAEWYPAKSDSTMEPGDIVAIGNPITSGSAQAYEVTTATASAQSKMIGIVSTKAYETMGEDVLEWAEKAVQVGLVGRVPVKIASNSEAIEPGDFLTVSDEAGRAKKSTGNEYTVAKALESWTPESGKTKIEAFINLSSNLNNAFADGSLNSADTTLLDSMSATDSATLTQLTTTDLSVLGDTTLGDTVITGKLSVGALTFDSIAQSIDAVGILKIQPLALGNIELQGGLVTIDTLGNIIAKEVTAEKYSVAGASAGSGTISAGNTSVVISTNAVTSNSLIFVTPKSAISSPLAVTEKTSGSSFKVEMTTTAGSNIEFDWWIVDKK